MKQHREERLKAKVFAMALFVFWLACFLGGCFLVTDGTILSGVIDITLCIMTFPYVAAEVITNL